MFRPLWNWLKTGRIGATAVIAVALASGACQPTVRIVAPKEPITINLNIKLDADVRVQLQNEAREDVRTKSIF